MDKPVSAVCHGSHAPATVTTSNTETHILYEPCVKPSGFKGRKAYSSGNLLDNNNVDVLDSETNTSEQDLSAQLLPPVIVVDSRGGIHTDVSGQSNEEVHSEDENVAIEELTPPSPSVVDDLIDAADVIRIRESHDDSVHTWQPEEESPEEESPVVDATKFPSQNQSPLKRARARGSLPTGAILDRTSRRRICMPQVDLMSSGLSDRTIRPRKDRPMRVVLRLPSEVLYDILLIELLILLLGALAFYLCQGGSVYTPRW